jgi:hypothetical protein
MAAVLVAGTITGLLAALVAGLTHCKSISDSMVESGSFLKFKDHKDKIGYQHTVSTCACKQQRLLRSITA